MAKKILLALCVLVALYFTACVTTSSVGGTVDSHGFFTMSADAVTSGGEVVASYGIILGLFDTGYETYAASVKKAVSEGKIVTSVTKWYLGIYVKITAYAK